MREQSMQIKEIYKKKQQIKALLMTQLKGINDQKYIQQSTQANINFILILMNIIASRLPALKFLALFGTAHLGFSLFSNMNSQSIMAIQQYMEADIKQKTQFTVVGMLKPKSLKLEGGLNKKWIITDNTYDIHCKYSGATAVELKQGETVIVTGYCPTITNKEHLIVNTYMTKHSMEKVDWDAKNKLSKKSYGLDSFR